MHPLAQQAADQVGGVSIPFVMLVEMTAAPGSARAYIEAFRDALAGTRLEPGNIAYDFSQSTDKPDTFIMYEEWRSAADLDLHCNQPYIQALAGLLEGIEGAPAVFRFFVRRDQE